MKAWRHALVESHIESTACKTTGHLMIMRKEKEEGVLRTLVKTHSCTCCGADFETDRFDPKRPLPKMMNSRVLCFTCAFWIDKIEHPMPNREIINGEHYVFEPVRDGPLFFQGHGGRNFYAIRNNLALITSNNVWFQGVIPERFREQLPDTARFIPGKIYRKLNHNPFICKSKGCWDRYHCIRYDTSFEKERGAWNMVPQKHVPGQEGCESFINWNTIEVNDLVDEIRMEQSGFISINK